MARGVETHNGKVILGDAQKLDIFRDLGKGKTLTAAVVGGRIELDTPDNWADATQVNADVTGLYLLMQFGKQPTGDLVGIRIEPNMKGLKLNRAIDVLCGGTPVSDCEYLMLLNPDAKSAWNANGDKTGGGLAGWIRILIGGGVRYIQLYRP